jgi:hypothetical protein
MKIQRNKKGELTTQQLVVIIILITSFAIILLLIFRLDLGQVTNKEICHNSVVMKGNSNLMGNLDCKTTYVCISGGEDCKSSYDIKIKINAHKEPEKVKREIMKAVADEMVDCWWMFGEGKLDYLGLNIKGTTIGEKNCALCSRIKFSSDLENVEITQDSFKDFLKETNLDNEISYSYYLYKTNNLNDFKIEDINTNSGYYILTGIADKGALISMKESIFGSVNLINKIFFSFVSLPKLNEEYEDYGPIPVILKKEEDIKDLECDEFLTRS